MLLSNFLQRCLVVHLALISSAAAFVSVAVADRSSLSRWVIELMALPASEQERLLRTEPAQTAFITEEMRSFLTMSLDRADNPSGHIYDTKWVMPMKDKLAANLIDNEGNIINDEYEKAQQLFMTDDGGDIAIELLCNATSATFRDGFNNQPGLLSALGSAICYFREAYRTPTHLAACERIGLSDYAGEIS